MNITEHFICGKHTAADCEDGIVITNDFAAVIDGSTSKTPTRHQILLCLHQTATPLCYLH